MRGYISQRYTALQYADFRLYMIGQLISAIGGQMQFVALNWHIYVLTNSAFALGLIGLMRFIPIVIFSLIGGSAADHYNRKKIWYATSTALAILATILAITTWMGIITPWMIYVITVFSAATTAFELPARQAYVPSLVKKEHIANAMSLNAIMWQVATIIGPALAGFAIARMGIASIYGINAISFIAMIIGLMCMKTQVITPKSSGMSVNSIVEGYRFVRSRTVLWSTMILDFFSTFFASATSLLPIFAKDILHVGPEGMGILFAAPAIGACLSGFMIAHIGTVKKQGIVLLASVGIYALATILFGLSTSFILSFVALFFVGVGDSVSMIIRQTLRQLETPDNLRGRMSAISMIFSFGGPQLGEFEAGLLASLFGSPISVVIGGSATFIVVLIMTKYIPALRKYDGV